MHRHCPVCKMAFEREAGYYTGAMFINWFLAIFIVGPVWLGMILTRQDFFLTMSVTAILLIVCLPLFFQYSRTIWLYLDYYIFHPE